LRKTGRAVRFPVLCARRARRAGRRGGPGHVRLVQRLTVIQKVFAFCAAVGGMLFLIRMVIMLLGMSGHGDVDAHPDVGGASPSTSTPASSRPATPMPRTSASSS